jgi:NAD(P)H-dependent flavin oxidoreductase YrpB (nitropropane dioxygenase family)
MRARTTRPYGVNLILTRPQEDRLRQLVDLGVPIISFFWGDASSLIPLAHAGGALVMQTVGTAADARRVVDAGVDIVVAQGWEAGGHVIGSVATLPLVPAVVDAVPGVPVVAAGGIADGRGLAAVLALGASAGWLGTRFVLAAEAGAHPDYRQRLLAATEADTLHSMLFDVGWPNAPHRTLRNSTIAAWESAGRPTSGRPGEGDVLATWKGDAIVRYQSTTANDQFDGDIEALSLWAGQTVGLVNEIEPAGAIVQRIADEAVLAIDRARGAVTAPH